MNPDDVGGSESVAQMPWKIAKAKTNMMITSVYMVSLLVGCKSAGKLNR